MMKCETRRLETCPPGSVVVRSIGKLLDQEVLEQLNPLRQVVLVVIHKVQREWGVHTIRAIGFFQLPGCQIVLADLSGKIGASLPGDHKRK